jgi:catechol 2,3-dioxygenase-like lactoylglutathione lyase family enzyme
VAESAVPILPSRDLRETLAFYERLGFRNAGAPPEEWDYLIVERGGIELHFFGEPSALGEFPGPAMCYLRVADADAVHAEWTRAGVSAEEPFTAEYGMGEFGLLDPSGNLLRVGSDPAVR